MNNIYDSIGKSYNATRRADPRVAEMISAALCGCRSVVDVGAGTGAYEPTDRRVVAVEPSAIMRRARPEDAAPCVDAVAEALPFDDGSFDATTAILTVHHWTDLRAGLHELRRVARRRIVILHWDQDVLDRFWLRAYFPEAFAFDRHRSPTINDVTAELGPQVEVTTVPVPHDCRDGFAGAYWRRPHAYLDPTVRAGISMLSQTSADLRTGIERLRRDIDDGTWAHQNATLVAQDTLDCGYRLITASVDE